MTINVLLVGASERESDLTSMLAEIGEAEAHIVDPARAEDSYSDALVDVVIVDLVSACVVEALELSRALATRGAPVIVIGRTGRSDELSSAFAAGADDYVRPPLDAVELGIRTRASLRRRTSLRKLPRVLHAGDVAIDVDAFYAHKRGERIQLSPTEFLLLVALAQRPGEVRSRAELGAAAWGYEYLGDSRLVDMAVHRLRRKIEDDPDHPQLLVTERGMGYRLVSPAKESGSLTETP